MKKLMMHPVNWLGVSTQDLYRGDQMSDKAETWFQNGDSHDLADPVQVWEKTHTSQVVNGHNDSSKGIIWMAHDLKK